MTETRWLRCRSPQKMLLFLRNIRKASERKLRLLACACCRRVWDLLPTEESRLAVLVAERFADGLASEDELATAGHKAKRPAKDAAARHIRKFPGAAGRAAAALRGSHAYNRMYEAYGERLGAGHRRRPRGSWAFPRGPPLTPGTPTWNLRPVRRPNSRSSFGTSSAPCRSGRSTSTRRGSPGTSGLSSASRRASTRTASSPAARSTSRGSPSWPTPWKKQVVWTKKFSVTAGPQTTTCAAAG